jgi:hypothetical protein
MAWHWKGGETGESPVGESGIGRDDFKHQLGLESNV